MQLDNKGWKERWPSKMVEFRERIPPCHRSRFRRFLEWLVNTGINNPGPSNLEVDQLERYAEAISGLKKGTQGAYLIGAVCGAQIVAPWLNLGSLRREAQDLVNAGVAYRKKGRSKNQGTQATLSIPVDKWPAAHRVAWENAVATMEDICGENPDDPFGHYANPDKLPAFSKNAGTRRNHAYAWGRWLFVMQENKVSWEVTPDTIELFIVSCLKEEAAHGGIAIYLSSIMFMLRIVAPKTDARIIDILRATRDSEKERHGQPKMMEIVHPSELARIGLELMAGAQKSPVSSRSAIDYRDGLLLFVGTIIPARSINLGGLQIGRDLFLDENPRIVWQAVDIKGRVAHTYDLPEAVADHMRVMRDKYRPMLMGAAADDQMWFWGPRRGGSGQNRGLTTGRINEIIGNRSEELLGKRVTGYSRRHSVATMITEEAPESIGHVTTLLQQGSSRSKSFYNRRAKKVLASRASAEVLTEIRQSFKKSA